MPIARQRLESRLWGATGRLRRWLRHGRVLVSRGLYSLGYRLGSPLPARVLDGPLRIAADASRLPRIGMDPELRQRLGDQTEALLHDDLTDILEGPDQASFGGTEDFWLFAKGEVEALPAATVEAMLLAAMVEDVTTVIALQEGVSKAELQLMRWPRPGEPAEIAARVLIADDRPWTDLPSAAYLPFLLSGSHLLGPDLPKGRQVVRRPVDPASALQEVPPVDGPRTVLFLLPFLAVGGAERLLYDLLAGWKERYRLLVVTLDAHSEALGSTLGRCRALTPHVYLLGDWLPREARIPAVSHLVRRWKVETLVSWNGTVDFFDRVGDLRAAHSDLRICNQLYHHRGAFAARTSPAVIEAVDLHLAVNRSIAQTLVAEHEIPEAQVALVHHGVGVPEAGENQPSDRPRREFPRAKRRAELGIPEDCLVVGSFIRLHAQKRPLDIVALARRFEADGVHFLLVGGGPMEGEVEAAVAAYREDRPTSNLHRLPMTTEPLPLYDALDICLMTSEYEGLPVFLLDGLARGIPGVAPAVGDIPLILGEPGVPLGGASVEQPGDLDALERALRSLLEPSVRRQRGRQGRRIVAESFGLEAYRRRYEKLFFPAEPT